MFLINVISTSLINKNYILCAPANQLFSPKLSEENSYFSSNKYLFFNIGFTTNAFANPPEYSLDQINAMIESLITNNYINTNKSITFPIRAIYAGNDLLYVSSA